MNPLTLIKDFMAFIETVAMAKHYKTENESLKKEIKRLKASNTRLQKLLK